MKAVMISIQPKWCELIANGEKTIEVRKNRPNIETPFKCYIYCTSIKAMNLNDYAMLHHKTGGAIDNWHGKVIGEFVCDKIEDIFVDYNNKPNDFMLLLEKSCLSEKELFNYSKGKPLYAWHISKLKIYDEPKELSEFFVLGRDISTGWLTDYHEYENYLTRPPQSWQYCEELEEKSND